jgi:hypothetical protein
MNKVFDYNVAKGTTREMFSSNGLEVTIAIDGEGETFAVTSGGGHSVSVFARNGSNEFNMVGTKFKPILSDMFLYF